jgi:hypothetical protein
MKMRPSLYLLTILLIGMVTMANDCTDSGWNMKNLLPTPKDSICTTIPEGESFICSRLRNPEAVNSGLYLAHAFLLDKMTLEQVQKERVVVKESIWWLTQPNVTYAAFQKLILEKQNSLVAVAAAEEISMFQFNENDILKADKMLLTMSMEKTLKLLELAIAMKGG